MNSLCIAMTITKKNGISDFFRSKISGAPAVGESLLSGKFKQLEPLIPPAFRSSRVLLSLQDGLSKDKAFEAERSRLECFYADSGRFRSPLQIAYNALHNIELSKAYSPEVLELFDTLRKEENQAVEL